MNITRISMANTPANFKGMNKLPQRETQKPLINTREVSDDEIVAYGNWGNNYAYPITAGQIRKLEPATKDEQNTSQTSLGKESEDEYYKRKLYSTEWTT